MALSVVTSRPVVSVSKPTTSSGTCRNLFVTGPSLHPRATWATQYKKMSALGESRRCDGYRVRILGLILIFKNGNRRIRLTSPLVCIDTRHPGRRLLLTRLGEGLSQCMKIKAIGSNCYG